MLEGPPDDREARAVEDVAKAETAVSPEREEECKGNQRARAEVPHELR
jgi:hypothetical protein